MSENVESERGFFGGAAHAAGVAAETALHATGAAATAVIGTAEAAAENIADVATGMTGNAADLGRKIAHGAGRKLRRTTSIVGNQYARRFADRLSPVVEGMGGDFGDGDDDDPEARIVVLRVEIASSAEVKVIQWINYILTLFALLATITLTVLKYKVSDTVLAKGSTYFLASVIISAVFLAALLITGAVFLWRIIEANRSGRKWSPRRAYISGSAFLVLICQILNLALMLAAVSDVMGSSESCGWWTRTAAVLGYVQWTCWNITFLVLVVLAHNGSLWRGRTADANDALDAEQGKATHRRTTALVMDAPFLVHLPKLVFWVAFQVVTSLILWSLWPGLAHELCVDGAAPKCAPRQRTIILLSFVLVIIGCYIAAYLYYAHRTNRDIRSRPYCEMRYARIVYGLQHEQVLPVFVALGICILLLIAVQIRSCWTYIETWLGVVPLQAVGTCMAMSLCLFFMPQRPDGSDQILQAWLQQFAWTYSSLPAAIQARNARLASSAKLASEPMFCLETAIKLLYFSNLAYTCPGGAEEEDEEADGSPKVKNATVDSKDVESQDPVVGIDAAVANEDVDAEVEKKIMDQEGEEAAKQKPTPGYGNMEDALSLYDLTDHEVLYEKETDTKALLAWGKDILMVAFKGTSSFENVLTDLNFFKVRHLPRRTASVTKTWGARLLQLPVRVHRGFYRAWMGHDYDQRIMGRIRALLDDMPPETRIYVTGHSLGGALATLCAHAIRTAFPSYPLTVYTYGEPRVGNHAFAHEYNAMVPEHFAVINDQDPVTRVPFGSYKRVGDRILINDLGDIAVRPSFLEMQVINSAGEVGDHFLEFYRQSIMRVIHSQFTDRHIRNGREGAAALAEELDLQKSLMCVNVDLASLEDPEKEPVTVEEAARRSSMKLSRKRSFGCGNGGMACGCGTEKVLKRTERAGNDEAHEKVTKVEKGQV